MLWDYGDKCRTENRKSPLLCEVKESRGGNKAEYKSDLSFFMLPLRYVSEVFSGVDVLVSSLANLVMQAWL